MSANTETTGADRTKCKAPEWCGINASEKDDDSTEEKARARAYLSPANRNYGEHGKDRKLYCSPTCRDARLPPVAAPAAHVERRKGQAWLTSCDGSEYHGTLDRPGQDPTNPGWHTNAGFWSEARWRRENGWTATLLSEAPPESLTAKDVFGEIPPGSKLTNDTPVKFASAPPAQEAPKAAPVWLDCQGCHIRSAVVILRDTRKGRAGLCESCMFAEESAITSSMMFESTGTPYAGPERLPRPKLAAD